MAHINLLPWREKQRVELNTEFGIMCGIGAAVMLVIIVIVHLYFDAAVEFQGQRNDRLKQEIKVFDKKIAVIKDLDKEKENLIARMNIIQQLQSSRPLIVHLFDAIVDSLPEGVSLTSIKQTGNKVELKGVAQSNARVSSFMRKIENSEWLANPSLDIIRTTEESGQRLSRFTLMLDQKPPKGVEDEEEE